MIEIFCILIINKIKRCVIIACPNGQAINQFGYGRKLRMTAGVGLSDISSAHSLNLCIFSRGTIAMELCEKMHGNNPAISSDRMLLYVIAIDLGSIISSSIPSKSMVHLTSSLGIIAQTLSVSVKTIWLSFLAFLSFPHRSQCVSLCRYKPDNETLL